MNWPPVKAWTSKSYINGQLHFVAINYGGELSTRWVIMMSVIDSSVLVKVSFSELSDPANWESGWDEVNYLNFSESGDNKGEISTSINSHLSIDSGLTIPITEKNIRPWFCHD